MRIPFIALDKINVPLLPEFRARLDQILGSSAYILGKEVLEFEAAFAKYVGARFAVSCNSGTDALFLSLKALGIGAGDEVITTAYSFAATVEVILHTGAKPVFVDINDFYCIDAGQIAKAITDKTKAILPVDLFGNPCDIAAIKDIADKHGLKVIEDACQAHGSAWRGKKVGGVADATCFSFYPTKLLGAIGDGGIVTTNDEKTSGTLIKLRNHGGVHSTSLDNVALGYCSRLDSVQAAFLNVKLRRLDEYIKANAKLSTVYDNSLRGVEGIQLHRRGAGSNHFIYTIYAPRAKELKQRLASRGIGSMIYYEYILPELYRNSFNPAHYPNALRLRNNLLALPMNPALTEEDAEAVCSEIKEALHSRG